MKITIPKNTTVPKGKYRGRLEGIEPKESERPFLRWLWLVWLANGTSASLSSLSSTKWGRGAKARDWGEKLLGRPIEDGEELETSDLVGREAFLHVSIQTKDGKEFNCVDAVEPCDGMTVA